MFGILDDSENRPLFWANFDEGLKITVQLEPEAKACLNLTMPHGLVLRFMSSGDVVQQYLKQKQ